VAVLRIDAAKLTAAPWGDSDKLEVGDQVLAVGSPYGLAQTVTAGIISAKERRHLPVEKDIVYQDFLQTDAAVNPGNSGGPLVNLKGQVVGINTAILGERYQGISFAIPSRIAQDVYNRLRAGEKIVRGWLGVKMDRLDYRLAQKLGLDDTRGALVAEVIDDSPAQKAGIEAGDVIIQWDNHPLADENDLRFRVASTPVGTAVKIKVIRDGKPRDFAVTVTERPSSLEQ
jgi:serine protease Do